MKSPGATEQRRRCIHREIRCEGHFQHEGLCCCDAGRTACCDEEEHARFSRICPPCSQSSLSLLHGLAGCHAATFWIFRNTCSMVQLGVAGLDIFVRILEKVRAKVKRKLETWFCHMNCGSLCLPFRSLLWPWQRYRYPQACWMAAPAGSRVSVGVRHGSRLLGGSCDVRDPHIRRRLLSRFRPVFDSRWSH